MGKIFTPKKVERT